MTEARARLPAGVVRTAAPSRGRVNTRSLVARYDMRRRYSGQTVATQRAT